MAHPVLPFPILPPGAKGLHIQANLWQFAKLGSFPTEGAKTGTKSWNHQIPQKKHHVHMFFPKKLKKHHLFSQMVLETMRDEDTVIQSLKITISVISNDSNGKHCSIIPLRFSD